MKKINKLANGVEVFENGNEIIFKGQLKNENVLVIKNETNKTWTVQATNKEQAYTQIACVTGTLEFMAVQENIESGNWELEIVEDLETEKIKMKAKELLNTIKNNQNIIIPILKNGKIVQNDVTGNQNDLFSYDWGYGIYGDSVKHFGQLDSRENSDEKILREIERLLDEDYEFGEIVNVEKFVSTSRT